MFSSLSFLFLLIIPLAVWVYALVDVIKHDFNDDNKIIWLLVVILMPLLGSILYLTMGAKHKTAPKQSFD